MGWDWGPRDVVICCSLRGYLNEPMRGVWKPGQCLAGRVGFPEVHLALAGAAVETIRCGRFSVVAASLFRETRRLAVTTVMPTVNWMRRPDASFADGELCAEL